MKAISNDTNRMTAPMTHAILGAGGVGGTIGAWLAHLGDSVTLVVRREVLAQYPRALHFESTLGNFDVNVSVASEVPAVDVLWVTVKATQLDAALTAVKNPGAVRAIVPLLNGVDHVALLRSKYGAERVIPATIAAEMELAAPGQIVVRGPLPVLSISSAGRSLLDGTLAQLQNLGFGGRFVDDEPTLLWSKLVFLAPSALSTTAADKPIGGILSDPEWRRLAEGCVREACAVGVAEGAKVDAQKVLDRMMMMPPTGRSSMQKDVDRHNPPELDAIAGPILRSGQKHGIDVPATKALVALIERRTEFAKQLA
jgi:2-dehydropantoate 2-reductase